MHKILKNIDKIFSFIFIQIIRFYQMTLSPDKGIFSFWLKWKICCHEPHCSQYSLNTLKRYWFWKWIFKILDRVVHCTWSSHKIYDPEFYKVVFFSSAPIWIPFMQELINNKKFEVVWVVTMPDTPKWRGMKMQENIIKKEAKYDNEKKNKKNNYYIKTPIKLRDTTESWKDFHIRLKSKKPDFLIVIAYGKIIPQSILNIPKFGPINVHGSLLPLYRWASPLQSVFLDQKKESWITIMKMDAKMDTWAMIDKLKIKLQFNQTVKDLIKEIQTKGPQFLTKTLWNYAKNMLGEEKQNEELATYCKKIKKEDGLVDPYKHRLSDIYAKYRAFALRPKIYFLLKNEKRVIIDDLVLDQKLYSKNKNTTLFIWKKLNPAITKISLKPEGKKAMDRVGFINGGFE